MDGFQQHGSIEVEEDVSEDSADVPAPPVLSPAELELATPVMFESAPTDSIHIESTQFTDGGPTVGSADPQVKAPVPAPLSETVVSRPAPVPPPPALLYESKVDRRKEHIGYLKLSFCVMWGLLQGCILVVPISIASVFVITHLSLVFLPFHIAYTYVAVLKTHQIGRSLTVIILILLPLPMFSWPVLVLLASTIFFVLYGLCAPVVAFVRIGSDSNTCSLLFGPIFTTFKWLGQIFVRFWTANRYSYFDKLHVLKDKKLDAPIDVPVVACIKGVTMGVIGFVIELALIAVLASIKFIPAVLWSIAKFWMWYFTGIGKGVTFLISLFPIFLIANMLLPVISLVLLVGSVIGGGYYGMGSAAVAHQLGIAKGFVFLLESAYRADRFSNAEIFGLDAAILYRCFSSCKVPPVKIFFFCHFRFRKPTRLNIKSDGTGRQLRRVRKRVRFASTHHEIENNEDGETKHVYKGDNVEEKVTTPKSSQPDPSPTGVCSEGRLTRSGSAGSFQTCISKDSKDTLSENEVVLENVDQSVLEEWLDSQAKSIYKVVHNLVGKVLGEAEQKQLESLTSEMLTSNPSKPPFIPILLAENAPDIVPRSSIELDFSPAVVSPTLNITVGPTSRPDEVAKWISGIGLSQDYSPLVIANAIDGQVLLTMTENDWKALGVGVFGDRRKLSLLTYNHKKESAPNTESSNDSEDVRGSFESSSWKQ